MRLSRAEADRLQAASRDGLLAEGRLSLVLDLDQTLLHATVDSQVGDWLRDESHPLHGRLEQVHAVHLPSSPHLTYYVRLRPGLKEFLAEMTKLFELHVYTMGSHEYAQAIVALIDADGKLFADRVLSRDHNGLPEDRKALQRLFPCDDRTVLVLDDRADVWQYSRNLVWIEPYSFWVVADGGKKTLGSGWGVEEHVSRCQNDQDQALACVSQVLKGLHTRYFSLLKNSQPYSQVMPRFGPINPDIPSVKDLLDQQRRTVLSGVTIAFSGLIPRDVEEPHTHYWWQLAEQHGARVSLDLSDPNLTHLISVRRDTAKAMEALKRGILLVHPDWLTRSVMRWKRQPEEDFQLPQPSPLERQPSGDTLAGAEIPPLQVVQADLVESLQRDLDEVSSFDDDEEEDEDDDLSQSNLSAQLGLPSNSRKRPRMAESISDDSSGMDKLLAEELSSE